MPSVGEILSSVLAPNATPRQAFEGLCTHCCRGLQMTGVGVALTPVAGRHEVVAATKGVAETLEDLQFTLGEGPGVDSFRHGAPVLEPDLAAIDDARWVGFSPAAAEAGLAAVFAFPVQIGAIRLGALDLYRATPGVLDDEDLADALRYGEAAAVLLLHAHDRMLQGDGRYAELDFLGNGAPELHQATGMVAAEALVGLDVALLLLRSHAFSSQRPIMEVARDVVARRLHLDAEGDSR